MPMTSRRWISPPAIWKAKKPERPQDEDDDRDRQKHCEPSFVVVTAP